MKTTCRTRHWSPTLSRPRQRIMAAYLRNRRPERAWGGIPSRSGSGLARKRCHSINSSARTRTPGANIKMCDHSMLRRRPHRGRISSGSVLLDADERDKVRQMLFREGLVWLPAGRDLVRPVRRLSTRVPASIASITRAQVVGIWPPIRISGDRLTHGQALGNRFNARLRCP